MLDSHWVKFVQNIFRLLNIDALLPPEELRIAISAIKNQDELNAFLADLAAKKRKIEQFDPCPFCGATITNVISNGRMGCAACYDHFGQFIGTTITKVQKSSKHCGKRPKSSTNEVDALKKKMDEAAKEERYEDAAIYRDKIKSLMNQSVSVQ